MSIFMYVAEIGVSSISTQGICCYSLKCLGDSDGSRVRDTFF